MKQVYLLFGYYGDHSAAVLFGVFETPHEANERLYLLKAANTAYSVKVISAPVGKAEMQEIF